jgi:hypothetical protein
MRIEFLDLKTFEKYQKRKSLLKIFRPKIQDWRDKNATGILD